MTVIDNYGNCELRVKVFGFFYNLADLIIDFDTLYNERDAVDRILDHLEEKFPNGINANDLEHLLFLMDESTEDYYNNGLSIEEYIDLCITNL